MALGLDFSRPESTEIELSPSTPDESEIADGDTAHPATAAAYSPEAEPFSAEKVEQVDPVVPPAVQSPHPKTSLLQVSGSQLQAQSAPSSFSIKPAGIVAAGIAAIVALGGVIWLFNMGKKGDAKEKKEKKAKKERRHSREWTVYGS